MPKEGFAGIPLAVMTDKPTNFTVIGAGLPRTGTASLKRALEILNLGPTHHMVECFAYVDRSKSYTKALKAVNDGKVVSDAEWKALVEGYNSGVDCPISDVYLELVKAMPDTKVILTFRPADQWWTSMTSTIMKIQPWSYGLVVFWHPHLWYQRALGLEIFRSWKLKYGSVGPECMQGRIDECKAAIPPEKLLIYEVKDGWAPLCKFLDVPIPSEPFPRINDKESLGKFIEAQVIKGLVRWGFVLSGVAAAVAIGITQLRK